MRVIYRPAHGGEPPGVIGASSVRSLGENVQSLREALTIICTWGHAGQKQGRLLVRWQTKCKSFFMCWANLWEQADVQASRSPALLPILALGFRDDTSGEQFSPGELWNNRSQGSPEAVWPLNSVPSFRQAAWTRGLWYYLLSPFNNMSAKSPYFSCFLKRKVNNLVKKTKL